MNWLQRCYWYYKLKGSPYRPLFSYVHKRRYVAIDCETTGLNPNTAEIITIAAAEIIDNQILTSQSFHIKLKAPKSLNANSVKIHQIRHSDLEDGLNEKQAITQLLEFVGNKPLVGYHIRYDKKILDIACKRHLGFPMPNPIIEVSELYYDMLVKHLPNAYFDLSLEAICNHLDIPTGNKHDALQDAICAAIVFVRLKRGSLPSLSVPSRRENHSQRT